MRFWRRRRKTALTVLAVLVSALVVAVQVMRSGSDPYRPGQETDGLVNTLEKDRGEDGPDLRFVDATEKLGIEFRHFPGEREGRLPEDMGSGVALGDVDGDGWTDAFFVNAAGPLARREAGWPEADGRCRLYRNEGGERFTDITEESGLGVELLGMAATFCDPDSDGDLDLLLTSFDRLLLFENDGSGRFTDVTDGSGLEDFVGFWAGAAVGDFDRDGAVDVYVCGYVKYDETQAKGFSSQFGRAIPAAINPSTFEPERNLLFHGLGDMTFEEVAEGAGVANPTGRSLGAVWADLNGDGLDDLYVANDVSDNALFLNRGDGTFEDRTSEATVGDYRGAMGLAVCDLDGDRDLDLFITHWVAQENALYQAYPNPASDEGGVPVPLFLDVADRVGVGHVGLDMVGWATRFFDADNDGNRDLFIVNGSTIPSEADTAKLVAMRSQFLWWSPEKEHFFDVGGQVGDFFSEKHVGRGGAVADFDLDGDDDLFVVLRGEKAIVLENEGGNRRRSLRLRLRQPRGNRFALGTRVRVDAGDGTWYDELGTQGSYLSQHTVGELSFGLGEAAEVDRIEVTWPDGTTEEAGPFFADSLVTWTRGSAPHCEPLPGKREELLAAPKDVDALRRFHEVRDEAEKARVAGDIARATELYTEALEIWPGHDRCLYHLGNMLLEAGDPKGALAIFERLVTFYPESNRGWMQLGVLRLPGSSDDLVDLDLAEEAFEHSLAINGEESRPVIQLGIVALLREDWPTAAERFRDATMLNDHSIEGFYFGGEAAYRMGDRSKAIELLRKACELAAGKAPTGESVSSEGDTEAGGAMLSEHTLAARSHLDRWRTLAQRSGDVDEEYGSGN